MMYISRNKKRPKLALGARGQFHFSREKEQSEEVISKSEIKKFLEKKEEALEAPHDMLIGMHSEDDLLSWRAPEFEQFARDKRWYLIASLVLLGIVGYAIFMDALIMAITFILIGAVGYIYIHKPARILTFIITEEGIVAGREIYEFENLKSFWIYYEPSSSQEKKEWTKILSLRTNSPLLPYVHIPIHNQDPALIREILLEFIPEEKQEDGALEVLERLLRL